MSLLLTLDLDGTLEDSRDDMVAAVQRLRATWGLPARPDADFRPHVNRGMAHLYRVCFEERGAAEADIRDAYAAEYGAHIADATRLYDGWVETLPRLAERARLAVVTNKPEALSEQLLTALGVRDHFAAVIGGDTCVAGKPDPVMIATAAERANVGTAARVIHVGDTQGDIRCARAFGARAVWCAWGYLDAPPTDPAADATVAHPAELLTVVDAALEMR
jgi:phosphoglycolate phosphatase